MSEQSQPTPRVSRSTRIEEAPVTQRRSNTSRKSGIPIHRLSIPTVQPFGAMMLDSSVNIMIMQIPPHTAARVLKGEIHNVLTVMRADPRYVSPHRFEDELVEQFEHPLLAKFRDLHAGLCAWESAPQTDVPDAMMYLPPFCEAIRGRDISASVTGAALSALHKFLLYGFLTNTPGAAEGMNCMSTALLQCTFEESTQGNVITGGSPAVKYFEPAAGLQVGGPTTLAGLENAGGSNRGQMVRRSQSNEAIRHSGGAAQHVGREGTNTSRTVVVGTMQLHDDEQVVLKLLELSALVVRCSLHPSEPLVSTNLIVGLLDTCLHVSHRAKRASPLLKSAAADSLGQIVLQVFSTITSPNRTALERSNTTDTIESTAESSPHNRTNGDCHDYSPLLDTRKAILLKLTNLLNPQLNNDATCASSLTLMNMAFETLREEFTPPEIAILQNDFCKYLLQWSTTHDLMILNLTLRVIFNLFQSMRNHLKVPLEVFLTSVHLRILDPTSSATSEEREVALESLLEFCQEVALMQDIYLNYDCDISCTNLYESICTTLGRVACADGTGNRILPILIPPSGGTLPTTIESVSFDNANNIPGMGLSSFRNQPSMRSIKGGAATASTTPTTGDDNSTQISDLSSHGGTIAGGIGHSPKRDGKSTLAGHPQAPQIPLNILNKLALDGILAILDSIFRRCQSHLRYEDMMQNQAGHANDGGSLDGVSVAASHSSELGNFRWQNAPMSEEDLQQRKIKKHFLALIAASFNEDPFSDKWIQIAQTHEILATYKPPKNPSPTDTRVLHKTGVAPDDVADLLYSTHGLNKASVGEYISKGPKEKYPFHAQVLDGFVRRYDFSEVTFAGAIRKFLSKFRLPGEAQCIDRLMEAFSKEYYEQKGKQLQAVSTAVSETTIGEEPADDDDDDDNPPEAKSFVFKNADAVFVLSFSTIMLNTDLHNPSMRRNRKMTLQQFIRNNRGINDGENIPDEFLTELYEQIKTEEIQVQAEVGEFFSMTQSMMSSATATNTSMEAFRASWDGVLSNRSQDVAAAFFTPPYAARQSIERAGVHDKEMFVTIARCGAIQSLVGVFSRSWDDDLVVRALRGMKQMAKMCAFFDTDEILNDILQILLRFGRDYILGCTALEHSGYDNGAPILPNGRMPMAVLGEDNDESAIIDSESPVPTSLLCSPKGIDPLHTSFAVHAVTKNRHVTGIGSSGDEEEEEEVEDDEEEADGGEDAVDVTGSAAHRGLLALDTAFLMLRSYASRVREAWPGFIDCICALRDARGLPAGLSDLDDFADSNGTVLPLSTYAQASQKRLYDHYRALLGKDEDDANKKKSWLRSFFGAEKKPANNGSVIGGESERSARTGNHANPNLKEELSSFSLRLLDVAENCDVEKVVVQMGSSTGNEDEPRPEEPLHHEQQFIAIQALLMSVDEYPFDDDPVMEQHAIFSLELAARALLTNREKATELFSLFLLKFESILSKVDDNKIPAPFMVERVVVTILRSSIHLYDLPDLRPHLRASLHLLMMSLPRKFISQISDRMACGLAIILRASFHFFETPNEWTFMGDTLDMLANYQAARGFVFDGIASTVEYALPSPPDDVSSEHLTTESASTLTFEHKEDEGFNDNADPSEQPPPLSKDACVALTRILIRFVLGFYQNDLSLSLPAMLCLEKVYRHLVLLLVLPEQKGKSEEKAGVEGPTANGKVPDKELWQNVIVSVYSVCRSVDEESSLCGMECYSRLMKETGVDEVSDDKWLAILYLMVNKQPPLSADVSRANTFSVLGQVLMMILPPLSHRSENWEDLTDLIQQIAAVAEENLREGRKGSVSLLFQKTVQTVTECANQMMSEDFDGDKEFSHWASETLLAELEKFGALGGSTMNVAATT